MITELCKFLANKHWIVAVSDFLDAASSFFDCFRKMMALSQVLKLRRKVVQRFSVGFSSFKEFSFRFDNFQVWNADFLLIH